VKTDVFSASTDADATRALPARQRKTCARLR